jgi:hypothetical protein
MTVLGKMQNLREYLIQLDKDQLESVPDRFRDKLAIWKDPEFRSLITKIFKSWEKVLLASKFYENDDSIDKFTKDVQRFDQKYPIFSNDLIDVVLASINLKDPIDFLVAIGKSNIRDENKLFVVQYLFHNFQPFDPKKYNFNPSYMYDQLLEISPKQEKIWLEFITFLSDFIDIGPLIDRVYYKKIVFAFVENRKKIGMLEKENQELKNRIQELELQVKYMPGGDGYLQAKEDFECLKIQEKKK